MPARAIRYATLGVIHRVLRTGNRRYEFERRYLEHGDAWFYRSNPKERVKFDVLLSQTLRHALRRRAALDVGCSIGILSAMLAKHFDNVVAFDVSREALRQAPEVQRIANLKTMVADARSFEIDETFDVVVCAGLLGYFSEVDAERVLNRIADHLFPDGVLIIHGSKDEATDQLGRHFRLVDKTPLPEPWGFVAAYKVDERF